MSEIRNVILIGKTGNGKSTLANVISDSDKFKESEFGVSETKDAQAEIVEVDSIKYRIVDTIGIGDTKLDERQVLVKIADAIHAVKEGVNQVLFVTSGRFTKEEIDAYNLMRMILFDENIVKYTTIVRTKFQSFRKIEVVVEDKKRLEKENKGIADVIKSCNKIIYVNNPSTNTGDDDTDSVGIKAREESRKRLLLHLGMCKDVYKPDSVDEINRKIGKHIEEKERKEREVEELKNQLIEQAKVTERKVEEFQNLMKKKEEDMKVTNDKEKEERRKEIEKMKKKFNEQAEASKKQTEKFQSQIKDKQREMEELRNKTAIEMKELVASQARKKGIAESWGIAIDRTLEGAADSTKEFVATIGEKVKDCRIS